MMREQQATLHRCGEDLPVSLGDGWIFKSSHIEDHGGGPFLVACWERKETTDGSMADIK